MSGDPDAQGGRPFARLVLNWWRRGGQFDWLTEYLHARGLAGPVRASMAVICAGFVQMAIITALVPYTPHLLAILLTVASAGFAVRYAILWARRWPTKRQSLTMATIAGVLTTLGSALQPNPDLGLLSCTGLALIGGYLALFHGTRPVIFVVALAVLSATVCSLRIAGEGANGVGVFAGYWLVVELNIAVPLAIQTITATLGADVMRSDHDPLTGVLNRRAFYERAAASLRSPSRDVHLTVIMVDLDKFKALNDTYGHSAGDQALAAVGWALRQNSTDDAIIGRAGGEEFVVLDWLSRADAESLPARLCAAIAALPHPVTASVGAVLASCERETSWEITALIHIADEAMYQAKRAGGNRALIRDASLTRD